jgi:hypothetical protein
MAMYKCEFYETGDLVMTLEIEGETRIDILKNILDNEWIQYGDFVIEEEDLEAIILNLLFGNLNKDSDDYLDDLKYKEYVYKLKTNLNLGLDLRAFLSEAQKGVNVINIVNYFCKQIIDEFMQSNDTLMMTYKITRT